MQRTTEDIRQNLDFVGCDNATVIELCDEVDRLRSDLEREITISKSYVDCIGQIYQIAEGPSRDIEGDEIEAVRQLKQERDKTREIVSRLADWSWRWNASTVYPSTMMERCNRELYDIEKSAREASEKARKQ